MLLLPSPSCFSVAPGGQLVGRLGVHGLVLRASQELALPPGAALRRDDGQEVQERRLCTEGEHARKSATDTSCPLSVTPETRHKLQGRWPRAYTRSEHPETE